MCDVLASKVSIENASHVHGGVIGTRMTRDAFIVVDSSLSATGRVWMAWIQHFCHILHLSIVSVKFQHAQLDA